MAEEKVNFFHKILIVVVMIYAFSKLSKLEIPKFGDLFSKSAETKTEPVRTVVRREFVAAPPQQTVIQYIPVPTTQPTDQRVYHVPETARGCSQPVITPPSTATIHIDDETYRRYFS